METLDLGLVLCSVFVIVHFRAASVLAVLAFGCRASLFNRISSMVEAGLTCSSISSALCDLHESWKLLPKTSEQRQHEGRVAKEGLKADDKS